MAVLWLIYYLSQQLSEVVMSVRFGQCKVVLIAAAVATSVLVGSVSSHADNTFRNHRHRDDEISQDERRHIRADRLRRRAQKDLLSRLGYLDVYPFDYPYPRETIDYYALSQQIRRLTTLLDELAERREEERLSQMPPSGQAGEAGGEALYLYGPEGPTPKSVRFLLEVRIMATGNPRLKVGEITDQGDTLRAEVVTIDGSLVDAYRIDKKTGSWQPIR
jgi:hypothetical protein